MLNSVLTRSFMSSAMSKNQEVAQTKPQVPKLATNRFGPNLFRITVSYLAIIALGITTFYFAKKEVDKNRAINMKIKQEIFSTSEDISSKYPSRFDLIKAEKEKNKNL